MEIEDKGYTLEEIMKLINSMEDDFIIRIDLEEFADVSKGSV